MGETEILPYDEYDSSWKKMLEDAFPEFMPFYHPAAEAQIDWSRGQYARLLSLFDCAWVVSSWGSDSNVGRLIAETYDLRRLLRFIPQYSVRFA